MICLNELSYAYSGKTVLDSISLSVKDSAVTVLLGPNGIGKTTLFNCMAGLYKVKPGMLKYDGTDICDMSPRRIAQTVSMVRQSGKMIPFDNKVIEFIVEGCSPHLDGYRMPGEEAYAKAEEYAEKIGIGSLLYKHLFCLSGGEYQMVLIARALAQETKTILMDEPLSALDLANQIKIMQIMASLAKQGKTILFSSHNPNTAFALSSDVILLEQEQKWRTGKVKEVLTQKELQKIYGEGIVLYTLNNNSFCEVNYDNIRLRS